MTGSWPRIGTTACLALAILCAACGRRLFERNRPTVENVNNAIPGDRFKIIATIAGGDGRTDLRMSRNIRVQLAKEGIQTVAQAGRWETEQNAVSDICSARTGVDGVLVVSFDRLRLIDCVTLTRAYEVQGSPQGGGESLQDLAGRLVEYLHGRKPS